MRRLTFDDEASHRLWRWLLRRLRLAHVVISDCQHRCIEDLDAAHQRFGHITPTRPELPFAPMPTCVRHRLHKRIARGHPRAAFPADTAHALDRVEYLLARIFFDRK